MSNLPFISKLIEHCMLYRFNEHCDKHSLLPIYQSAYRRFHSCETALVKMKNDPPMGHVKQELHSTGGYRSFSSFLYSILIEVMNINLGVNGTALKWLETYLRPRWFKVKVVKEYSNSINLEVSVPQGSCGGPVYTHAMHLQCRKSCHLTQQ